MPVLCAQVIILFGELEDVVFPWGSKPPELEKHNALAIYTRQTGEKSKYPHTCIIASRNTAISLIAHEAVHCACMIQEEMGWVPSFDNDELTAYIVGYICERAETFLGTYE